MSLFFRQTSLKTRLAIFCTNTQEIILENCTTGLARDKYNLQCVPITQLKNPFFLLRITKIENRNIHV